MEAGLVAGRPRGIRITHFGDQCRTGGSAGEGRAAPDLDALGIVACAAGPGLATLFREAGAVPLTSEIGQRPSTQEFLDAVAATRAHAVVILPNDSDSLAAAETAAQLAGGAGLRVTVIPSKAQVHGLAAVAVHDPDGEVDAEIARMSAAAGACRDGAVTVAARSAMTSAGPCAGGDALGVVQGDFVVIGSGSTSGPVSTVAGAASTGANLVEVACEVADRLLAGGGELVTLVRGVEADDALVSAVESYLKRTRIGLEVVVLDGGQERYPLLIGVE